MSQNCEGRHRGWYLNFDPELHPPSMEFFYGPTYLVSFRTKTGGVRPTMEMRCFGGEIFGAPCLL